MTENERRLRVLVGRVSVASLRDTFRHYPDYRSYWAGVHLRAYCVRWLNWLAWAHTS